MLGPKKLQEIRQELRQALKSDDSALEAWLEERLAELRSTQAGEPKVVEDLLWVQRMLSKKVEGRRKQRSIQRKS
jgi:hypothetical protein